MQFHSNLHAIDSKVQVYNQFVKCVFTISYIQSIQIFVLLFLFLSFYNIHTGVAGSPLLLHYNFCSFSFAFGKVCQQRDLPLFDAAVAVNAVPSSWFGEEGECDWVCLYLGSLNRGLQGSGG